jgi:branched-chain amino acid transport system permease protein
VATAARTTNRPLRLLLWLLSSRAVWIAAFAVFALAFPFTSLANPPWLNISVFILIFAIGALGLNVLTGYTGQVSLGHAFFIAAGAYTAAVLGGVGVRGTTGLGLTAAIWIPAAGVVAAVCGLIIGPTALRLRGLYLGIVTIGLVFIGQHIWVNVTRISGGPGGRTLPSATFGSFDLGQDQTIAGTAFTADALNYYLALFILAAAMLFVWNLARTRMGRAMQAVRERELAANLMGINLARTKITAFVISSFLAGVCGALYGTQVHFAAPNPQTWDLILSIQFVAIIIVGGIGTVSGALLGAIFIGALPQVLSDYAGSIPGGLIQTTAGGGGYISSGDAAAVCYGLLIIIFLIVEPRGVVGLASRARRAVVRYRGRAASGVPPDVPTQRSSPVEEVVK